jgi:hypothetical protein
LAANLTIAGGDISSVTINPWQFQVTLAQFDMPLGKAAGAAAVQDASRFSDATGFRASVLECASPRALSAETYQAVNRIGNKAIGTQNAMDLINNPLKISCL